MFKNKKYNIEKKIQNRSNTLEEGMITFGQWLYSKDNSQRWDNRLVLKQFVTSSHAVLQDNTAGIGIDIVVDISNGIPLCRIAALMIVLMLDLPYVLSR